MISSSAPTHPAFRLLGSRTYAPREETVYVYKHESGAKVVSICCEDSHKCFCISFPTLPVDHSGLTHILEHSVLCGSRKFPVKEPFKEMLKTSLQTFLNAFTYPDRTCYPVSSCNLQDFYHLMDVYLDAVFHPRLTPAVLGQEGWHYQWDKKGKLRIQGVVYNEMKGAYANPEDRLDYIMESALLPDTPHRFDSGGNPAHIPDLDFETFIDYHRSHYHPGNAVAGFYGDDDPVERLERLHAVFSEMPARPASNPFEPQAPWSAPRTVRAGYPVIEGGSEGSFAQRGWLLPGSTSSPLEIQRLKLIDNLLLQEPTSPLRLRLLDSGLGDDIIGGAQMSGRQPVFLAGMRGVTPGREAEVFALLDECLEEIASNNFRPDFIEAMLDWSEFNAMEISSVHHGLHRVLQASSAWIHGGDPLESLDRLPGLQTLREELRQDPGVFANWVREHLIDSTSRVDAVLFPDDSLAKQERAQEKARLKQAEESFTLNPAEREAAEKLAEAVKQFQTQPDAPEDVAKLPRLSLNDVSPPPVPPPFDVRELEQSEVSRTHLTSNRVVYLHVTFDFRHIPLDDLPLLPVYSRCLTELGTESMDAFRFNEVLASKTGGMSVRFETSNTWEAPRELSVMWLKVKALKEKIPETIELVRDMLRTPLLGPADKVKQLLTEERAGEEAGLIQSGNRVVRNRIRAGFHSLERACEQMDGLEYLWALRKLEELPAEDLMQRLQDVHRRLIQQTGCRIHAGADAEGHKILSERLARLVESLPAGGNHPPADWPLLTTEGGKEGLVAASPVNFVGTGFQLPALPETDHFSYFAALRLLNTDYLWEQVRVRGGAYGCGCDYTHLDHTFSFSSYRDPHIKRTLDCYRSAGDWLLKQDFTAADLEPVQIAAMGKLDGPETPETLTHRQFSRYLTGSTYERRLQYWQELCDTTPEHLRRFGAVLSEALNRELYCCVLGGPKSVTPFSPVIKKV